MLSNTHFVQGNSSAIGLVFGWPICPSFDNTVKSDAIWRNRLKNCRSLLENRPISVDLLFTNDLFQDLIRLDITCLDIAGHETVRLDYTRHSFVRLAFG